jgi:cyclic pyranopterin phosphate synthase
MPRLYQIGSTPPPRDIPSPASDASSRLVDAFGRRLTYLRVSVTDRCNLRCLYCLPEDAEFPFGDRDFLDPEGIEKLVGALVGLGIRQVRITGGEPLVRKDILEVVRRLRGLPELDDLALSTNGTELARLAAPLREAGIDRVNVSMDTLNGERFHQITRRDDLEKVWLGVEAALAAGFDPVKLNSVLMADHEPEDIDRLVDLTLERPLAVRFIEMMPTATNEHLQVGSFRSCDWVKRRIEAAGTVGFITPLSHTFCHDCNRLRLTARGEIRLCLFADRIYPLRELIDDRPALEKEILRVLADKPAEHMLAQGDYGNLSSFMEIGG